MSGVPSGIFREAGISGFYRDDSLSRVGSVTVSYKPTGLSIFVSSFIGVVIFRDRSCIYYKPKNHLPTTSLLTTEKNDRGRGWNGKKKQRKKEETSNEVASKRFERRWNHRRRCLLSITIKIRVHASSLISREIGSGPSSRSSLFLNPTGFSANQPPLVTAATWLTVRGNKNARKNKSEVNSEVERNGIYMYL